MQQRRRGSAAAYAPLLALAASLAAAPAAGQGAPPAGTAPAAVQVQAGGVRLSLGAGFGLLEGTAHERVYAPGVRDFKISELSWDLEGVGMAGFQAAADFGGRFRAALDYWAAVSEGEGGMVDRDWLILGADSDEEWTHESRHPDTSVDAGSLFDASLGVRAFGAAGLSLSGIVGYRRTEWEWSARGGSYVYTWDTNGDGLITADEYRAYRGTFPDGQEVIAYRQEYSLPYLGVGCEGAWGAFALAARVLYSPWVSAEDHDFHALRDTTFAGDFSGGEWLAAEAAATWGFAGRWYATAGVAYEQFAEVVGDVTVSSPEGRSTYGDSGAVELESTLLRLAAGLRF